MGGAPALLARNSAVAEKSELESEGGQKFLPPNPLPFCPPERSVSAARSAAISRIFAQNRFELRSAIATNQDILKIEEHLIAHSPRRSLSRTAMRERVSLRKKPCISELNQRDGQIQIQFFGKANGGSACEARNPANGISNFFRFFTKQVFPA
jgi:hypothetical protein